MTEKNAITTGVEELARTVARQSPWEKGLGPEQRREAWLGRLAALEQIRVEAARQAETAAARAVEFGADPQEVADVTGRGGRRWAWLFGRGGRTAGAGLGTLSAHGRAASIRRDNLPPV
ncbi:hypothetical protein [Actinoplanes couchii]|uniref:Uncharacterized protein n=1 Tax=Actinoplanes couchii TaxID=403638 RepID=A0ABQ3X8Q7_9ACTN|nr:hypothetical protein [Actinoplanes couchii]MDR6320094.1 hypothetical protein [Actinoplanes couchii]GID54891.1 hypothetical protein Aco03nite_032950 [Actinoplanes couchii]